MWCGYILSTYIEVMLTLFNSMYTYIARCL